MENFTNSHRNFLTINSRSILIMLAFFNRFVWYFRALFRSFLVVFAISFDFIPVCFAPTLWIDIATKKKKDRYVNLSQANETSEANDETTWQQERE